MVPAGWHGGRSGPLCGAGPRWNRHGPGTPRAWERPGGPLEPGCPRGRRASGRRRDQNTMFLTSRIARVQLADGFLDPPGFRGRARLPQRRFQKRAPEEQPVHRRCRECPWLATVVVILRRKRDHLRCMACPAGWGSCAGRWAAAGRSVPVSARRPARSAARHASPRHLRRPTGHHRRRRRGPERHAVPAPAFRPAGRLRGYFFFRDQDVGRGPR